MPERGAVKAGAELARFPLAAVVPEAWQLTEGVVVSSEP